MFCCPTLTQPERLDEFGAAPTRRWDAFVAAADPSDPKGTSDEAAAAKHEGGEPISKGARDTRVPETALSTALNVSYMAEQIGLFSIVVGIALLLSGVGFIILALMVLGGRCPHARGKLNEPRHETPGSPSKRHST